MPKYGSANISALAYEIDSGWFVWKASVDSGEDPHARYWANYDPGNPTNITVNIIELQPDQRALVRLALQVWQDVANVNFSYTSGTADITYTDAGSQQAATSTTTFWDGLTNQLLLTSATVDVSRDWAGGPAAGINSYFFQTLVHETGHALGLGHSGDYNHGTVNSYYNTDATLYANDTWQWSIMSYNDQTQYGGASYDTVLTPQMADIYAVQATYGSGTARTGDTIYGFNSNAGDLYTFQSYTTAQSFTIYDSGGTDTLDCSQFIYWGQTIDLRAGNWSSIGGKVDNISIYPGVVIENAIGGAGNDAIIGNDANNILTGGAGNDQLDGGFGTDTFYGGPGDDQFEVRNAADIVVENPSEGTDRYDSYVSIDALPANVENIVLYGATDLYAIANDLPNAINGSNGSNGLYGLGGDDQIYGYGGNDWIDGGPGNDTMVGGPGNDTYQVDSALDVVVEKSGEGIDQVDSYLSYTLGANIENLVLYGTPNLNGTGNGLANALNGNFGNNFLQGLGGDDTLYSYDGNDVLNGGTGADVMVGGTGNDIYYVDNAGDVANEAAGAGTDTVYASVSYTLTAGSEIEYLRANAGATGLTLTGNALNNTIVGGAGSDTMNGGAGNDVLNGGTGADVMVGGTGNDIYYVDNVGDTVTENPGEGTDTIYTTINYTIATGNSVQYLRANAGSKGLVLTGNDFDNTIVGGAGSDTLNGGGGNDVLNGGAGVDVMSGGTGNDTYYVDNPGDVVNEAAGAGTDTVYASVSYTLTAGSEIEYLRANAGATGLTLTGNALNNTIVGGAGSDTMNGGAGNDVLNGGTGADVMVGGTGNDIYYVDNVGDTVTENPGEGTDTIYTTINYTIGTGNSVQYLRANAGSKGLVLTGNDFDNTIVGGAGSDTLNGGGGNDVLNGGAGADVMSGGTGNDTYYVDNPGDVVNEAAGAGTDTVKTTLLSKTLGSNLENLAFIGSGNFAGTGNTLNNVITGGAGNDTLNGGAGNDTLNGGAGNDGLTGGTGLDSFLFNQPLHALTNVDNILDFSVVDDTILLSHLVFTALGPIGTLPVGEFFAGSSAGDADDRIIYNSSTGALSYDSDGTGAAAPVQFALLTSGPALTNADFRVV